MPLLLLLLVWELQGASRVALGIAGAAIVAARLLHAVGFGARLRPLHVAGSALTYLMEASLSVAVLMAARG